MDYPAISAAVQANLSGFIPHLRTRHASNLESDLLNLRVTLIAAILMMALRAFT